MTLLAGPDALLLRTAAGDTVDAELFRPPGAERPAPGIVIVPEMYGMNDYVRDVARNWAARGYFVLVFDVLWRIKRKLVLAYEGPDNATAHAHHDAFDLTGSVPDMQAAIDALRALPGANGKVGIVGFCLGGTLAYLAAARTDVDAAAGYYGSRIIQMLADVPAVHAPTLLIFGAEDGAIPPADRDVVMTVAGSNPLITSEVYAGARHAFANHVRPDRFHPAAARAAEDAAAELFRRALQGSTTP